MAELIARWTLLFALLPAVVRGQEPKLSVVMARAADYVAAFEERLSGIATEERYHQEATPAPPRGGCRPGETSVCAGGPMLPQQLDIRSDLILVRPDARTGWVQYRDVFEVDGAPLGPRGEGLKALLSEPARSARDLAERLVDDSARYNIGDVVRTVNVPLFALQFLRRENQGRFRFRVARERTPDTERVGDADDGVFRVGTEVWVVTFEERSRPTYIRTLSGQSIPAEGRFWIEPETGRVQMSEMVTETSVRSTIGVSYRSEPLLGMLVPVEMRERYVIRTTGARTECTAVYGAFRVLASGAAAGVLR